MAEAEKSLGSVRFGRFELSADTGELRKDGVRLKLSGQAIQVLSMLVANPGQLVTREELQQKLWPGASYGDPEHGLNAAVNKLRETLGDSATEPTHIETVPGRGYRFIGKIEPEELGLAPEPTPSKPRWKWKTAVVMLALIGVAMGFVYYWLKPRLERQIRIAQLQHLTVVQLTALVDVVITPIFSPDGSEVAFGWRETHTPHSFDLYVKVIGNEKPLRLTYHPGQVDPAWSPDGRSIAIVREARDGDSGIFLVPPIGGAERKLLSRRTDFFPYTHQISWSPDGKQLAYVDAPEDAPNKLNLFLLTLESLEVRPIKTGCDFATTPRFSPHRDYLTWICNENPKSHWLMLRRLSDGSTSRLLQRTDGFRGLAWSSDGRRLVFSTDRPQGDLWEIAVDHPNQPDKLPVGHDAGDVAVSPTGDRLVYVQTRRNFNIWEVDLSEAHPIARKIIMSSREESAPAFSPDGTQIAFASNRSGSSEVWVSNSDGSDPLQLTFFGADTGSPQWSPDSKLIAFDSRTDGQANIYTIDRHGGAPRKLSIDKQGNSLPYWSHDGAWIYFANGADVGKPSIWKVPSGGGHAVQISKQGERPMESSDGRHVFFVRDEWLWNGWLWKSSTDGSAEERVAGMPPVVWDRWVVFGSDIYFVCNSNQTEICSFDVETAKMRTVTPMNKEPPSYTGGISISRDGKRLLFPQRDEISSDLMMIENWR
jgi:Tol biopolymer transport system component/DNA-binding winged helix-turn-helix (wHTH) protein